MQYGKWSTCKRWPEYFDNESPDVCANTTPADNAGREIENKCGQSECELANKSPELAEGQLSRAKMWLVPVDCPPTTDTCHPTTDANCYRVTEDGQPATDACKSATDACPLVPDACPPVPDACPLMPVSFNLLLSPRPSEQRKIALVTMKNLYVNIQKQVKTLMSKAMDFGF